MPLNYEFKWSILWADPARTWIVEGLITTIVLSMSAWILALAIGLTIGTLRIARSRALRFAGGAYVEVFRNVPLLLQLFIWYFAVPLLLPREWMLAWNRLDNVQFLTALVGLSLYMAARVAEQIRSGLESIPKGQFEAARASGLSEFQMYRYVIVPYAFRVMIPAISSEFMTTFKNSALALTIGVAEITYAARSIEAWSFRGIEAFALASATYMATTAAIVVGMAWLERRLRVPGLIARR